MEMEGPNAYYSQSMYQHDGYNVSTTGYHGSQQPACVYARNVHNSGYGGQPMSVVEQELQAQQNPNSMNQLQQTMQLSPGSNEHMNNTTPAHIQNVHQMTPPHMVMAQPPPAHQSQNMHSPPPNSENLGQGGQNSQGNNLQFPWMKTTKSHAAQWKAQWPG